MTEGKDWQRPKVENPQRDKETSAPEMAAAISAVVQLLAEVRQDKAIDASRNRKLARDLLDLGRLIFDYGKKDGLDIPQEGLATLRQLVEEVEQLLYSGKLLHLGDSVWTNLAFLTNGIAKIDLSRARRSGDVQSLDMDMGRLRGFLDQVLNFYRDDFFSEENIKLELERLERESRGVDVQIKANPEIIKQKQAFWLEAKQNRELILDVIKGSRAQVIGATLKKESPEGLYFIKDLLIALLKKKINYLDEIVSRKNISTDGWEYSTALRQKFKDGREPDISLHIQNKPIVWAVIEFLRHERKKKRK